jgi:uncharacterized phage infection (PIP) family protein YhgE
LAVPSPSAGQISEVLNASPDAVAPVVTSAAESPLKFLRFAAVAAIGLPLITIGFIWNHLRAGRSRFAAVRVGPLADGVEEQINESITPDAPTVDYQTTAPAAKAAVINSPTIVPPVEEKTLTSELGQEQQSAPSPPEEQIRLGVSQFSQTLQDLTANICSAVDKLGGDVGQAIAAFAAEQRATLLRQEELLAETKRISEQARAEAERATQAVTHATSSQDNASELLSRLQEDRNGLKQLINDVRNRIAALSVLAAPLPEAPAASTPESNEPPATPSWSS